MQLSKNFMETMQSAPGHGNYVPIRALKQVKVDNWGTFFLQRLLQLYFNEELLDLIIKFETCGKVLKVSTNINFNQFFSSLIFTLEISEQ